MGGVGQKMIVRTLVVQVVEVVGAAGAGRMGWE